MRKPRRIDWEAVARTYRTGKLTQVELASKFDIDPATLNRKIKRDREADPTAWPQDLTEAVRQATNARLMTEMVNSEVKEGQAQVNSEVKIAAELNAQVILQHRSRVKRVADVAMRMLEELDATTLKPGEIEALCDKAEQDIEDAGQRAAFRLRVQDLLRLHTRIASSQKLMGALKDAQQLEAQTFGLYNDKTPPDESAMTDEELDVRIRELMRGMGVGA